MATQTKHEMNLIELMEQFGDEEKCRQYLEHLRWPNGTACPKCWSTKCYYTSTRKTWECDDCGYHFSVTSGELDLEGLREQPDEEIAHILTSIRGVGLWTVQWILISSLGRTDGFPHGDLALQRTMGLLVNGGKPMKPEEALDHSLRWGPYRTYLTTYLFAATRSGRLDILSSAEEVPS